MVGLALAAQVQEDEESRQRLLAQVTAASDDLELSFHAASALRSAGVELRKPRAHEETESSSPAAPSEAIPPAGREDEEPGLERHTDEADAAAAGERKADGSRKRRSGKASSPALGEAVRDPAQAEALASEGAAALRAGRRQEAESLFHKAISFDRKNLKALLGLSDVYFDTQASQKAVIYAEKAVAAAPSNATARLKLGDAYFNVLRYKDALEQYEKARTLGSTRAGERIAKINAKLGQ